MKNLFYLLIFLLANIAYSQSLSILDIDTTNFPLMKAKFIAFDKDSKQISNLSPSDFKLTEDGIQRNITSVSCPKSEEPNAISSVLTIDVSGSMSGQGQNNAKSAATAWINGLLSDKSECAVTAFSNYCYLIQDFTNDKIKLIKSLDILLSLSGGTNYDAGFWQTMISGLEVARRGNNYKILVFLSDGEPNFEPQTQKIIDLANKYNIAVYCVTLNMPAPQCLKDISAKTGGLYFENIISESEIKSIYLRILNIVQNEDPCTIEWISDVQCPKYSVNVNLALNSNKINAKSSYILPFKATTNLELIPSFVYMWNVPPGKSKDTTIVVKARNGDFNVTNIVSSNPNFTILPTSFNLKENESQILTITYKPIDSLINFCTFDIENDKCPAQLFVRSGFPHQPTKNSTFRVTHPNGGEQFGIGTDTIITWEGCSPDEKVALSYSYDNGKTYKSITKNASGLKYSWHNIPNTPSNQCLIKASLGNIADTNDMKLLGLGSLSQVVYTPDGTNIASGGGGGIFIWNKVTGDTIFSIKENTGYVLCFAFSPDGSKIASGSYDGLIKLWDVKTGTLIKTFSRHNHYVTSVCFSPDGNKIASGSLDNTIKIWDVSTSAIIADITGLNSQVSCLSFSPDGSIIANGSGISVSGGGGDNAIWLWDVKTGVSIGSLRGHVEWISSICFNKDGSKMISGSLDKTIKLWDVKTRTEIKTFAGSISPANCVSYSPIGDKIISGCVDGSIQIWNINSGTEITSLQAHSWTISSLNFSPDGNNFVSGSSGEIKIWNVNTGFEIKSLEGHTSCVFDISYNSDGSIIASGASDGKINLWNTATGKQIRTMSVNTAQILSICFSPDGNKIVTGSAGSILIWNANNGALIKDIKWLNAMFIFSVCFSPDGSKIACGSANLSNTATIKIFDANSGAELKSLEGHKDNIFSVCFSPDGTKLASGSADGSIKIWDVNNEVEILSIPTDGYVYSVKFSPDGNTLASGSAKTYAQLWDVKTGAEIKSFNPHKASLSSVCFSPDGTKLASGSWDATIKIWDINSGDELRMLTGHNSSVSEVSFNPGGNQIASGSADGIVRIWSLGDSYSIEDVSDSLWAIIAPKSITKDIDMGKVLVGSVKDSVIQSFIVNMSDVKSRIDSIKIIGVDEDQFDVVSGLPPYILEANQMKNVEFRFKPTSSGIKNAKIYVYSAMDTIITNIRGEGVIPELSIENKIIDFGQVKIGEYKDTIAVTTIKNIGSAELTITNTKHNKPNDVDFTTISGGGSFILAPGETHEMNLRFTATEKGLTEGTLEFEYNGVGSPAKISLIAEGISYGVASAEISAGSLEGFPGDIVNVPIILTKQTNLQLTKASSLQVDLSYNSTLLLALDLTNVKIDETTSKVTISNLPVNKKTGDTLANVRFRVGLGNADGCDLLLSNAKAIDDTVNITLFDGYFKLLGVCPEGGKRLINPTGKITISSIKPNPADDNIEIKMELTENSGYKLSIINSNGQIVREINRTNNNTGIAFENIEVTDLATGVYNLILQTESERLSKMFLILK